jgi:prepilin-type N-terminal cleavage/methylation domain-containing protein
MNTQTPHPLPTKRSAHVAGTGPVPSAPCSLLPKRSALPISLNPEPCSLTPRRRRPAFTLVELLVVITIISILAALATVGVMNALTAAKNTRIKMEIAQLDAAIKAFKLDFGTSPPCDLRVTSKSPADSDPLGTYYYNAPLRQFLARAFPRYNHSYYDSMTMGSRQDQLCLDIATIANGVPEDMSPARALVFWLSYLSPDTTNPFQGAGTPKRYFEFDKTRLVDASGNVAPDNPIVDLRGTISYLPPGCKIPYAYFDSRMYGRMGSTTALLGWRPDPSGSAGYAFPYAQDLNNDKVMNATSPDSYNDNTPDNNVYDTGETITDGNANGILELTGDVWANADSFQIISAGQDNHFGGNRTRLFPTGTGYDPEDRDNITNFNDKTTLEDAIP